MLKQDLPLQIFNQTDHCLKGKKVIGLTKDQLGGQIMKEFAGLRAKTYSYLKTIMVRKKIKTLKKCATRRKAKFQDDKNSEEKTQIENK